MIQKVFRSGNSLAISVPARLVRILGLKAGTLVTVRTNYLRGTLTLSFPQSGQMTLLQEPKGKRHT